MGNAQMHFWLSSNGDVVTGSVAGETPQIQIPRGAVGEIYVWAKPDEGKTLENFSLNLVSSSETAIEFVSAEIINEGRFGSVFDTSHGLSIEEQSICIFPAPLHGVWGLTALSVDPDSGTGLNAAEPGGDLNYDSANGSFLVGSILYNAVDNGFTELLLEIGNIGMNYDGEQAGDMSVLLGSLADTPLSNAFEDRCIPSDTAEAEITVIDPIIGDFNANGSLDAPDIDLLSLEVVSGTHAPFYELTGNATVNELDRVHWVEILKETFFGDVDLDGSVGFGDFLTMSANFGQNGGWAQGDMNGDQEIGFADFLQLSGNFGQSQAIAAATATVPESIPDSLCIAVLLVCSLHQRRNR